MFLKNYTSNVPVSDTLQRIEKVLIRSGVSGIMKEYAPDGRVSAITFEIRIANQKPYMIRLPANEEKATNALWKQYVGNDTLEPDGDETQWPSKKRRKRVDFVEQGSRTAWKIIQDWIEVQMSMIQMEQADTLEVFMPYIWDGEQTVYNRIKTGGYRALLPEKV
jgi:hypothetical protein